MRWVRIVVAWCFAATALLSFWNVVRFLPTKVYIDAAGQAPSLTGKVVLICIFVAIGSLFVKAWWTGLRAPASSQMWPLLASFALAFAGVLLLYVRPLTLFEKGWIPLGLGLAGLAAFYRKGSGEITVDDSFVRAPAPWDGTNAILNKLVVVISIAAVFFGDNFWLGWADANELSDALPTYFYVRFALTILLVIILHEGGHLLAALALRMKVVLLAFGPFEWSNSLGDRKLRIPNYRSWLQGRTLVAPIDPDRFRQRKILQVAAGPLVNLVTGGFAAMLVLMSPGREWEGSWLMISKFATISLAVGLFNLVPFRIGPGYSDGAKLFQLISSELWCRYHLLLGMILATGVSPVRARDFDLGTIREAMGNIATGQDEAFMRLCEYSCLLDKGELTDAAESLRRAAEYCEDASIQMQPDWTTVFVFGAALLLRDAISARKWWTRFEKQKTEALMSRAWTSYSALMWIEGRGEEAEYAWQKGDRWARGLHDSGWAASERNALRLLRKAMEESPDPCLEKLTVAAEKPER